MQNTPPDQDPRTLLSGAHRTGRQSGIEALRILAMSMIIIWHFMVHPFGIEAHLEGPLLLLAPWVLYGVNLFFLISGWFGVKLRMKSLVRLLVTLMVFGAVNFLAMWLVGQPPTGSQLFMALAFPISGEPYWFMEVYLLLLITAPLINLGLARLSDRQLRRLMALFTFATVYSCAFGHNAANPTGYTYLQCLYMYCLGYWARKDFKLLDRISDASCFLIYAGCSIIPGMILYFSGIEKLQDYLFMYCNPFLVFGALALFLFFARRGFVSTSVNYAASLALGCYLLQDGWFGKMVAYDFIRTFADEYPLLQTVGLCAAIFAGLWLVSAPVTWIAGRLQARLVTALEKSRLQPIQRLRALTDF